MTAQVLRRKSSVYIFKVPQGDDEWNYKWRKDTGAGKIHPGSILLLFLKNRLNLLEKALAASFNKIQLLYWFSFKLQFPPKMNILRISSKPQKWNFKNSELHIAHEHIHLTSGTSYSVMNVMEAAQVLSTQNCE